MKRDKYTIICFVATLITSCILLFLPHKGWSQNQNQIQSQKQNQSQTEKRAPNQEDKVIAHIGETTISMNDLKEYLSYRPLPPETSDIQESLKQRLEEMITSEALYQEALRQNIQQDPMVRRIIQQTLTQKLLEEKVENPFRNTPLKEEVQAYYEQHNAMFNRPEQVRLADIFFAVSSNETSEQRSEKRKRAESILAEAKEKSKRPDFGRLIIKHSDTHPKYPLGDTGYIDAEGNPLGLSPQLAKAAFALNRIGEICDYVIETDEGYHVIMVMDKRSALYQPFDEVKGHIEQKLRKKKSEENRKIYIEQVKSKIDIQRNDQAIVELYEQIKKKFNPEAPIALPGF